MLLPVRLFQGLTTSLFKELYKDMNSNHEVLLCYTPLCWLSKGNVVNRVFELKGKINLSLEVRGKHYVTLMMKQEREELFT